MRNWYDGTYKALLIAAIISFIIYFFSSGQSSLGALISGLVVLTLSLILIIYTVLYNIIDGLKNASFIQSIITILNVMGPFLMMLFVICLFLYLLVMNKERIIKGRVPKSYYTFSNIIILILLLEMYFLYKNINSPNFESIKKFSKMTGIILYFFNIITGISAITLYMILKYYSADG